MSAATSGIPAGMPSTSAMSRGPWDSPAVDHLSRVMPERVSQPSGRVSGARHPLAFMGSASRMPHASMSKTDERASLGEWDRLSLNGRAGGVRISVHVRPKSSRSAILGVREGALDVALTAAPTDGAANAELLRLVSRALQVTQRDVTIVAGTSSRSKVLEVNGISVNDARARLSSARRSPS